MDTREEVLTGDTHSPYIVLCVLNMMVTFYPLSLPQLISPERSILISDEGEKAHTRQILPVDYLTSCVEARDAGWQRRREKRAKKSPNTRSWLKWVRKDAKREGKPSIAGFCSGTRERKRRLLSLLTPLTVSPYRKRHIIYHIRRENKASFKLSTTLSSSASGNQFPQFPDVLLVP